MTFKDRELSARGGKPRHLFVFIRQSVVWRYASGVRDVTIGGMTYTAAPISRSEIKQTVEQPQDQITITLPYSLDPNATDMPATQSLGENWNPYVPSDTVSVVCMAYHEDDPDQEVIVEWQGQVTQPKFTDGQLELVCKPASMIDRARYQGPKWQRSCWKSVYSTGPRGCGLIAGAIPVKGTVTAISGSTVTAAAWTQQQRTFAGGTATWTADVDVNRSGAVTAISGSDVTLDDVTDIDIGTACTWTGGGGTVTAVAGSVVTLDSVTGLAVSDEVDWTGSEPHNYSANITAYDADTTTITLDDVTHIAVGTKVTAHTTKIEIDATITAMDGLTLTASEFADSALGLAGGYLWWTRSDGIVEQRSIMDQQGDKITILSGGEDLAVGTVVTAVPGCDHTWSACVARGNDINYGGALFKPVSNPYHGQSMSWK